MSETDRKTKRALALSTLADQAALNFPDLTSLLVMQGREMLFERYFEGGQESARDTQSVTKSIVSLLVGVALAEGLITSIDQPVLASLTRYRSVPTDQRWAGVTVRHLLTMTAGLPSELLDEKFDMAWYSDADPLRFSLEQPLLDDPGTTFRYSNASVHVLGAFLTEVSGAELDELARTRLFAPLDAEMGEWLRDVSGRIYAAGCLQLTSRAMARLGQLMLGRGRWQSRQIVPENWVQQIITRQVSAAGFGFMEGLPDYGYLWWLTDEDGFETWYACGWGGQYIVIVPDLELVMVATGRPADHTSHRGVLREALRVMM